MQYISQLDVEKLYTTEIVFLFVLTLNPRNFLHMQDAANVTENMNISEIIANAAKDIMSNPLP